MTQLNAAPTDEKTTKFVGLKVVQNEFVCVYKELIMKGKTAGFIFSQQLKQFTSDPF